MIKITDRLEEQQKRKWGKINSTGKPIKTETLVPPDIEEVRKEAIAHKAEIEIRKSEVELKYKKCSKCRIKKPATLEFFYKVKNAEDGLRSYCKECERKVAIKRDKVAIKRDKMKFVCRFCRFIGHSKWSIKAHMSKAHPKEFKIWSKSDQYKSFFPTSSVLSNQKYSSNDQNKVFKILDKQYIMRKDLKKDLSKDLNFISYKQFPNIPYRRVNIYYNNWLQNKTGFKLNYNMDYKCPICKKQKDGRGLPNHYYSCSKGGFLYEDIYLKKIKIPEERNRQIEKKGVEMFDEEDEEEIDAEDYFTDEEIEDISTEEIQKTQETENIAIIFDMFVKKVFENRKKGSKFSGEIVSKEEMEETMTEIRNESIKIFEILNKEKKKETEKPHKLSDMTKEFNENQKKKYSKQDFNQIMFAKKVKNKFKEFFEEK